MTKTFNNGRILCLTNIEMYAQGKDGRRYEWLSLAGGDLGGDLIFFEIFCVFPSPCLTDNQEKDI